MTEKRKIDWESIESNYRAGIRSIRDIAGEYGCSHVAIQKKADKEGWDRDLSAKIKAAANAKVTKAAVTKEVTTAAKITEREIVETNATMQANIILSHRNDIGRGRALSVKLFDELESVTDNKALFEELGELLHSPDEKGVDKRNELYRKVIDMPSRIDGAKKLAETLRILIDAERKAVGIKDDPQDAGSSDELITMLKRGAGG